MTRATVTKIHPEAIELSDGARAEQVDGALELRDREGRLLLRYQDGAAEVVAATGDLKLAAPQGAVLIDAATDVHIRAARDVVQEPARKAAIEVQGEGMARFEVDRKTVRARADEVAVVAKKSRLATGEATVLARAIATTATSVATQVERYELTTRKLIERSRTVFREVEGLIQTKAGRTRTLVQGVHALFSKRTVMVSKKDTSIDGSKVLLG